MNSSIRSLIVFWLCYLSATNTGINCDAFPIFYSPNTGRDPILRRSVSSLATTDGDSQKVDSDDDWNWQELADGAFAKDQRPIVLFDGVCNLCNGGVNFAIDRDESAKLRFCSLQSKVAEALLLRSGHSPDESNIAYVTKEDAYFSSEAVAKICMQLDTKPLQVLGQIGQVTPNFIRETVYKYVSTNRYYFGENDQCRLDFDGTYTSRFVSDPTEFEGGGGI